ncbi:hypothetical protein DIPPA_27930 [Diplonema papillatum]|nr:hypothetical protein DIPPA_27930 [Diplonema papillatum]
MHGSAAVFLCLIAVAAASVRMSSQEARELNALKRDRWQPRHYPVRKAADVALKIAPLAPLLDQMTRIPYAGRRTLTRCKWTRLQWRKTYEAAVAEVDGQLRLPFRTVNGSSIAELPIETMSIRKTFDRLIPRAYVDADAWKAKRWVFLDLGARYFVRKHKSRCFGSTYQFLCGYPGAHRFDYYAFDVNGTYASGYPDFVHWTTAAIWHENTTIAVSGVNAGTFAREVNPSDVRDSDGVQVPALDFADWLIRNVAASDFVVVKMDIENAEFRVVDSLFETGALELIDEVFIECHGALTKAAWDLAEVAVGSIPAAWIRSLQCFKLERRLRRAGIFLHEWD